jgi:hypothetical protein
LLVSALPAKRTRGLSQWARAYPQSDSAQHQVPYPKHYLGWADYRLTNYASIERWWELVMSAHTLVSLQRLAGAAPGRPTTVLPAATDMSMPPASLESPPAWDAGARWKHLLNNLCLLIQPYVCTCLLLPWLQLVPLPYVQAVQTGLAALGSLVNTFRLALSPGQKRRESPVSKRHRVSCHHGRFGALAPSDANVDASLRGYRRTSAHAAAGIG